MIEIIKAEKQKVFEVIKTHFVKADGNTHEGRQARQELIDIGKFITASKQNIEILESDVKIPDLLIRWDGVLFGLEHTEIINKKKKVLHEQMDWFTKEIEKYFLDRYGNIQKHINFSFNFEINKITNKEKKSLLKNLSADCEGLNLSERKIMNLAHPGYLTTDDLKSLVIEFAEMAFIANTNKQESIDHELINYISLRKSSNTIFTRSVTWSGDDIQDLVMQAIREKETRIDTYIENTKGLKQCLFLVIQGCNGYSDYAHFNDKILIDKSTLFDKVIAFNFFTNDYFILK